MISTFAKYHGLGNDFVVVERDAPVSPADAVRICDRRFGVGADGVISILPAHAGGVAFMHLLNSDGSVAPMCGNGIRCVAHYLAERRGLGPEVPIETGAGLKRCRVRRGSSGAVEAIAVDMGPARWLREEVMEVGGERLTFQRVDMGSQHAVTFGASSRARATAIGPLACAAVPGGVNVGFAALRAGGIDLVVWERGAGLTEACGTGASAAALSAVKLGLLRPGEIEVRLPGGPLRITIAPNLTDVVMEGPAEHVFEGRLERGV